MTVLDPAVAGDAGEVAGSVPHGPAHRAVRWLGLEVVRAVATLIGVMVVVFVVLRLIPGNQITASLGVSAGLLTPAQLRALDHFYGIGQPIYDQFWQWLSGLLQGNFGLSIQNGQTVTSLLGAALPVTLELAVLSMIIGVLLGVGLGVVAAAAPGRVGDWIGQGVAQFGLGVPSFVIGSGLVAVLASVFRYFPSSQGFVGLSVDPGLNFQQVIFPALTLGIGVAAAVLRTTRGAMLDVSRQAFVRSAHGKGLRRRTVVVRHVLRNALVPVLTMSGIQFGYLLGGTVIVEQIFVLPGLGRLLLTAINQHDYAVAQGATLVFAAGFVLVNIVTDALYAVVDPRVRR